METRSTRGRPRRGLLSRFLAERSGLAALEFATVAPFMLFLYLGGTELTMALTTNRRVEHVAATINDLVSQSTSLTSDDLKGIYQIAAALIPTGTTGLKIRVTAVDIASSGSGKVVWSCPTDGISKLAAGTDYTLPAEIAARKSGTVIVAETQYSYLPLTGYSVTGAFSMGGTSYLDPRDGASVSSTGCNSITL